MMPAMQRRSLLSTFALILAAAAAVVVFIGGLSDFLHAWDELYAWLRSEIGRASCRERV